MHSPSSWRVGHGKIILCEHNFCPEIQGKIFAEFSVVSVSILIA